MKLIKPGKVFNKFDQPYTLKNSIEWVQSGYRYFDLLVELIDKASFEIHLQTYIFLSDETGLKVAEALIRAAERKVQVFVLVDAYGTQEMSKDLINRLKQSGILFRKYGEFFSKGSFHIGRRMHHKVTVIDGTISIVGGINISNHYNDLNSHKAWLDFAIFMKGNISRRLQYVCRKRWIGWHFSFQSNKKLLQGFDNTKKVFGTSKVRVRRNDFIRNKNEISISYREVFRRAEQSILLVGGYFLPGRRSRKIMKFAIDRGVKIKLIVSRESDVKLVLYARKYLYSWLIRNGIDVYEYTPSNVHGKVIIADEKWVSLGSYDLNNLSTYSNIELNVDIDDESFSKSLSTHLELTIKNDCKKISSENIIRETSILTKFLLWISYRLVKTFFMLSVLLAGKKEKEF